MWRNRGSPIGCPSSVGESAMSTYGENVDADGLDAVIKKMVTRADPLFAFPKTHFETLSKKAQVTVARKVVTSSRRQISTSLSL